MGERPENYVFLGDSLTEGVGSARVSFVSELAALIRSKNRRFECEDASVNEFRLRQVNRASFDAFVDFNVAGYLTHGENDVASRNLWLWNLACEGHTVASDFDWLPLINALRPKLVIVFRGSLESIVRPAVLKSGLWPWWIPHSWRSYASMDPRCYFSTTWWRRLKQTSFDSLKQSTRLRLLQREPGIPLMDVDTLADNLNSLLTSLCELDIRVLVLGLLPVSGLRFPTSPEYFTLCNERLRRVTTGLGVEFFDWGLKLPAGTALEILLYRDGFHPNLAGSRALASLLFERLFAETVCDSSVSQ